MNQVLDNLKYFSKLSATAAISFLKINLLGAFSTVLSAIIGIYLSSKGIDAGHSAHVSAAPWLVMVFAARPIGTVLMGLVLVASPFLFFMLGNKYTILKIAHRLLNDKAGKLIYPLLDKVFEQVKQKQPDLLRKGASYSMLKLKMLHEVKNGDGNKWVKRLVAMGISKIQLDEVDFNREDLSFADIIKDKIIDALQNLAQPSTKLVWLWIAVQWLVVILIGCKVI
jgi:hypothetical protein